LRTREIGCPISAPRVTGTTDAGEPSTSDQKEDQADSGGWRSHKWGFRAEPEQQQVQQSQAKGDTECRKSDPRGTHRRAHFQPTRRDRPDKKGHCHCGGPPRELGAQPIMISMMCCDQNQGKCACRENAAQNDVDPRSPHNCRANSAHQDTDQGGRSDQDQKANSDGFHRATDLGMVAA
jgi:hypothetical protein